MLLGHYIIISIFLGRRPNVQDFNVSKQPWVMAATLRLLSQPYVGLPITIQFTRDGGVRRYDYVSLSYGNERLKWEWCHGKTEIRFPSRGLGTYSVTYFDDGGYLLPGTQIKNYKFELLNPVISAGTTDRAEAGDVVWVTTELHVACPVLTLTLRAGNVRIASVPLNTSSRRCETQLVCPRVPGEYWGVVVGGNVELHQFRLCVHHPRRCLDSLFTLGLSYDEPSAVSLQRALLVSPNQTFFTTVSGSFLHSHEDIIIITKASHLQDVPKLNDLPFGRKEPLGAPAAPLSVQIEGLYHVVLGAKHNGVFLIGAWALLVVTSLTTPERSAARAGGQQRSHSSPGPALVTPPPAAASSLMTPERSAARAGGQQRSHSSPRPALVTPPPAAASSYSGEFMCVVCQDRHFQIKLDPCKHVCLCEMCWKHAQGRNLRQCPLCRRNIESSERIYFA